MGIISGIYITQTYNLPKLTTCATIIYNKISEYEKNG